MTKQTAEKAGLDFTGHYDFTKTDFLKNKCAEIRKQGFKAYIVTVKANPLSRCGRNGFSIYTEPKYRIYKTAEAYRRDIASHAEVRASLIRQHEDALREQIAELNARQDARFAFLAEHGLSPI